MSKTFGVEMFHEYLLQAKIDNILPTFLQLVIQVVEFRWHLVILFVLTRLSDTCDSI